MAKPVFREGDGIGLNFDGISLRYENTQKQWFIARITQIGPLVSINQGRSGGSAPVGSDGSVGSISSALTSTPYGWVEQAPNVSGVGYMDKPGGLEGNVSVNPFINPAFEINDAELTVGDYVLIRQKCFSSLVDNQVIFECVKTAPGSSTYVDIDIPVEITYSNCQFTILKKTYRFFNAVEVVS